MGSREGLRHGGRRLDVFAARGGGLLEQRGKRSGNFSRLNCEKTYVFLPASEFSPKSNGTEPEPSLCGHGEGIYIYKYTT